MSQSAPRTFLRHWKLWSLSAPLVTALLAVECCAVLLVVCGLLLPPAGLDPRMRPLRTAALLVVVAAVHTELGRDAERVRRSALTGEMHVNMASVWFFAAAALLSPGWAGLCAVVVHGHLWWRSVGPRVPPYRQAYTTAVFVLATAAASAAMAWLRGGLPAGAGVLVLAAGLLVFFTVNTALVAGAMAVAGPPSGAGPGRRHGRREPAGDRHAVRRRARRRRDGGQPVVGPARGAAAARAPARRPRAAPGAGGEHRREDRPAQRRRLARARRARGHPARPRARRRRRCSCSTSTTSRTSTTPTGTSRATRCWPRWPMRCAPRCVTATSSAGSAARSS